MSPKDLAIRVVLDTAIDLLGCAPDEPDADAFDELIEEARIALVTIQTLRKDTKS